MSLEEQIFIENFALIDEEIGAEDGMKKFVTTEEFRSLNVGFSLDEGECELNCELENHSNNTDDDVCNVKDWRRQRKHFRSIMLNVQCGEFTSNVLGLLDTVLCCTRIRQVKKFVSSLIA